MFANVVPIQVKREHYKALSHFYTALGLLDHEVLSKFNLTREQND